MKFTKLLLIRTVLGNQTNVEQFLEVAEQRNLVAWNGSCVTAFQAQFRFQNKVKLFHFNYVCFILIVFVLFKLCCCILIMFVSFKFCLILDAGFYYCIESVI
jgi:hypothetical protein